MKTKTYMWKEENNQLVRNFVFRDFTDAFAFMTRVAALAEELDHHPWWSNVYNEVTIKLSTHSAGNRVTAKDTDMADRIGAVWENFNQKR